MPLRSGKEHLKQGYFNPKNQPFKLVLLPEKMPRKKYKVNIDFDEASLQWRKNKIPNGHGGFIYKRSPERIFNRR